MKYLENIIPATDFKSKDYFKLNSYSILSNPKFLNWRHKNYIKLSDCDYENGNADIFKENLGTHNFAVVMDNKIWLCWAIDYNDYIFLIFSSNNKTTYEVVYPYSHINFSTSPNMGNIIIGFHYWLLDTIFGLNILCGQ